MRKNKIKDLDPNEIFIDASNLPSFNKDQFEGNIERGIENRAFFGVIMFFSLIAFVLIFKTWFLQVENFDKYNALSETNRLRHTEIFSERGILFDRNDVVLAQNEKDPDETEFLKRKYSSYEGLGHLLGFVKYPQKDKAGFYYATKIIGVSGIEKEFDKYLSGENGIKIVETDALGKIISQSTIQESKKGEDLHLTIDVELNEVLYKAIKRVAQDIGYVGGAGGIMDLETGEMLALTSYPEFDSQILTDGSNQKAIEGYSKSKDMPYLNRFIDGLYSPGSTVKPVIALGALNENIISPSKEIFSSGSISIPNPYDPTKKTIFKDNKAHGWVDMKKAIAVSSNVYFYSIGGGYENQIGLGIERIEKYMRLFGYGESTNGPPYFAGPKGVIPNPSWKKETFNDIWRIGDTYNSSIGQYGFQVSPLQELIAVGTIGNDGKMVSPIILKEEIGLYPFKILPIEEEHFKVVKAGMLLATRESNSARGLYFDDLKIGAKTGTAQVGMKNEFINSWVVGFFPFEKPKYAFVGVMERGPSTSNIGALFALRETIVWMKENTNYLK